jgi:hypothetical protein
MNPGTLYAAAFAAELRALAALSVVRNDSTLAAEIEALQNDVGGYGILVAEVCNGFGSFSGRSAVAWNPLAYPVLQAGGATMVDKAKLLSARLNAIEVPQLPERVPSWTVVKGNVTETAKGVVSSVASTAKSSVATALVVGAKTLVGRNPFKTLKQRLGQENIDRVVDRVRNPVSSIQSAASVVLPRLKRGLDLGVGLGTELADVFVDMISETDYVTVPTADQLQREAFVAELATLKALANSIELSATKLCDLSKVVIHTAAVQAIQDCIANQATTSACTREALRTAVGEIAEADIKLPAFVADLTGRFERTVGLVRGQITALYDAAVNEAAAAAAADAAKAPEVADAPEAQAQAETPVAAETEDKTPAPRTPRPRSTKPRTRKPSAGKRNAKAKGEDKTPPTE